MKLINTNAKSFEKTDSNVLIMLKNEYSQRLVEFLKPSILRGLTSIFIESSTKAINNNEYNENIDKTVSK